VMYRAYGYSTAHVQRVAGEDSALSFRAMKLGTISQLAPPLPDARTLKELVEADQEFYGVSTLRGVY
jgi:hypothetical protein